MCILASKNIRRPPTAKGHTNKRTEFITLNNENELVNIMFIPENAWIAPVDGPYFIEGKRNYTIRPQDGLGRLVSLPYLREEANCEVRRVPITREREVYMLCAKRPIGSNGAIERLTCLQLYNGEERDRVERPGVPQRPPDKYNETACLDKLQQLKRFTMPIIGHAFQHTGNGTYERPIVTLKNNDYNLLLANNHNNYSVTPEVFAPTGFSDIAMYTTPTRHTATNNILNTDDTDDFELELFDDGIRISLNNVLDDYTTRVEALPGIDSGSSNHSTHSGTASIVSDSVDTFDISDGVIGLVPEQ